MDDSEGFVADLLIACAGYTEFRRLLRSPRNSIAWFRREKWARQIVEAVSVAHDKGVIFDDISIDRIGIDMEDDAQIMKISPSVKLLPNGFRSRHYLGCCRNIYQVGKFLLTLGTWEEATEPVSEATPDGPVLKSCVPQLYRDALSACLSLDHIKRPSAGELLNKFFTSTRERVTTRNSKGVLNAEAATHATRRTTALARPKDEPHNLSSSNTDGRNPRFRSKLPLAHKINLRGRNKK